MQSSAASKTPSIKRGAQLKSKPNVAATVSANSKADSLEIEEISKKISEHADALYRTWKSRGLVPPADILEFYTVEAAAAAAAGTSKEALQSTEGLQKLVNTFVIKDKEQRSNGGGVGGVGKQATSKKSSSCNSQISKLGSTTPSTKTEIKATTTKTNTSKVNRKFNENVATNLSFKAPSQDSLQQQELHKSTHVINMQKQQQQQQQQPRGLIDGRYASTFTPEKEKTAKSTEDVFERFNKPTATTINTLNNKNTKMKTIKMSDKMGATNTPIIKSQSFTSSTHTGSLGSATLSNIMSSIQQPSASTSATTTNSTNILNKNLNFDIDLDLKFDINLNVQQLSQLQTQNLKKIKELLLDSNAKTPTRIPTPANSALSSHAREKKPLKITTSLVDDLKQQQQQQQQQQPQNNLKDETNFADSREKKKSRELQADIMPNKEKDALMRQLSVQGIYVDNENDDDRYSNGTSKRQNVTRKLTDPDSAVTITTKPIKSSPLLHANNQLIAPTTAVCHIQSDIESVIAPLNTSSQGTNASQVDSTTIQTATTNKSNKTIKSTTTKAKDHKLKDISNTINQTPSARQSKEDTPITTTTLPLSPSSPLLAPAPAPAPTSGETAVVSLISNMEVARNSSSNDNSITAATTMPTPTKLKSPRNPLSNGQEKNLRSNFFTRGSVAERVLMFEKCPDVRHAFLNIKRPEIVEAPKVQVKVKLHTTPPPPPQDHTSLQREYRALKSVYIPRFYFPHGKPQPQIAVERTLRGILSAFDTFPNNQVTKDELPRILKICGLPFYWRMPVVIFCQQSNGLVERQRFVEFWKQMNVYCHEEASRFIYILSRGQRYRNYILPEDLVPLVQDVVDTHPGLAFLKEATEFHSRYVHTVIARIFYSVNRSWSGKISMSELKKSDLLEILCLLEEEDDINQIMAFFSYEHFYVIYCKFWELDKDHDLLINQDDLARHSDHALSTRIIERIFSGCVTRNDNRKHVDDEPKMSYTDFVWFLLSEEDKRTPTAIEYWFRCMDLDGDGALSMYELEYFYEEQQQRMESIGIESLPFEDCLCQMLDMIKPQRRDAITLGDLKKCKMTHVFFDTFFNLEKYLDHEQRDPFATQRDEYSSDWDRFAAQEYELLITEEND